MDAKLELIVLILPFVTAKPSNILPGQNKREEEEEEGKSHKSATETY